MRRIHSSKEERRSNYIHKKYNEGIKVGIIYRPSFPIVNTRRMGKIIKKSIINVSKYNKNDIKIISSQRINNINLTMNKSIIVPNVTDLSQIRMLRKYDFALISVGWAPLPFDVDGVTDLALTFEPEWSNEELSNLLCDEIIAINPFNMSSLSV